MLALMKWMIIMKLDIEKPVELLVSTKYYY